MDVNAGTIVVWADLACPWATLAVHRIHVARQRLGLDDAVRLDHRAFPLEVFNGQVTPKKVLDAEVPVVGALAPEFGWKVWQGDDVEWPDSVLLALEAVQAAKEQSLPASEALDLALRRAFFVDSRPIGMRHVILEVAGATDGVDSDQLADALDDGRARASVMEQQEMAEHDDVKGSPHLFFPDGTDVHNPGIEMHWEGEHGEGFPVVDRDDPSVYDELLSIAAHPRDRSTARCHPA